MRFLRQPALQVESWGRGWRAPLQQAHGDLRVPAALHLLSMWSHLGNDLKVLVLQFIYFSIFVKINYYFRRSKVGTSWGNGRTVIGSHTCS